MKNEDIMVKIEQLEKAIKQLASVKTHLLHNATEIKGQVQTTMSRHLEALRNREVWLLNQVDLVFSAKESVLQTQQARLHKMLGVLQSTIGLTADSNMDAILVDALQKLNINLNDLNPEETAFFTFRADQVDLRNTILNYGHVDANGMPLFGAFHEPESETLPRHFEDYEGPQHHVFHKTVGDNIKSDGRGIYVNIPKLSTKSEDWLFRPTTQTTYTDTTPRFSFPAFSSNSRDWIRQKSTPATTPVMTSPTLQGMSSNASINDWLCQIKRYADPGEEEDFEIVENSGLSSASSYSSCSDVSAKPPPAMLDLVKLEFPSAVQTWLKSNKTPPEGNPKVSFQHISSDPDHWLLRQPTKTCEECENISADVECIGDRLGNVTCSTVMSNFYKSCPSDRRCWLKSEDKTIEMPNIQDVCKANERCEEYQDCVCSPHCGFQHIGITDAEHWLFKSQTKDPENLKEFFQHIPINGIENWLSPLTPNECDTNIAFRYFEEMSKETMNWIKEDEKKSEVKLDFNLVFNFTHDADDQHVWLKSGQIAEDFMEVDSVTWNIVQEQHRQLKTSDWLIKIPNNQSENNKDYWLFSQE